MAGGQIAFEAERLALAHIRVDSAEAYENAVRIATEVSAHALGVERVGVWHLHGERELELTHLYTASNRRHSTERKTITLPEHSAYGVALHARRAIIADDVTTNAQTAELDYYCKPLGITSMLDAPFYYSGAVGGVICHEHIGAPRTWSDADVTLACSIADMAAVICGQAKVLDAQERLRDATTRRLDNSRVETLANVAAAVGHELSNTLTAIQLAMLRIQSTTDPRVAELAPSLMRSISLATELLDGLKNFGRAGASGSRLPITDVLPPLLPMLNLLTRGAATVTMELADPGVSVGLPDGDMQQILVNLVINASNALATAGRNGTIAITSRALGTNRVELVVRDDGPGVAPEISDRLFELYATTSAHGTGVGLWLVKQIVTEVGGSIRYEPGVPGARFVIELPRRSS
jgi:two-component system, cell cycle sensor histidine kinase and response regulator CckA